MNYNLIFIGGIHGVGKTTLCSQISKKYNINHLSASQLIKWNSTNKEVKDIDETQKSLISELNKNIDYTKLNILEGHFVLWNQKNEIKKISFNIFKKINPNKIILIIENSEKIKKNLEKRDKKQYSIKDIEDMQNEEINYAKDVANKLNIELLIYNSYNFTENIKNIIE